MLAQGLLLGLGLLFANGVLTFYADRDLLMFDAHAYWLTGQPGFVAYSIEPGQLDAFLYSPAFSQAIAPISWLPWPAFALLWVSLELCAFAWLLRPLGWAWALVLLVWCVPELVLGNIYGFLAVATVLALTGMPSAWALPVLTKPVLGIGLVWHIVRREWRALGIACGSVAAITTVSFLIDPRMWVCWIEFLVVVSDSGPASFLWRVGAAIILMCWAAATDRSWAVPIGLLVVLPVIGGLSVLTILTAIPRLWLAPGGSVASLVDSSAN